MHGHVNVKLVKIALSIIKLFCHGILRSTVLWPYTSIQSVIDMDSINRFINFTIKLHNTNVTIMI
jgi:hypothetical protein